jgi:hypothetical protein
MQKTTQQSNRLEREESIGEWKMMMMVKAKSLMRQLPPMFCGVNL